MAGTQEAKDSANGAAVAYLDSTSNTSKTYIVFEESEAEATRSIQQLAALGNTTQTCPAGLTPKVRIVQTIKVNVPVDHFPSGKNATNVPADAIPTPVVPTPSPEEKPAEGTEKPTPTQAGPTPRPEPKSDQVSNQISWPVAISEGVVIVVAVPLGILYVAGGALFE